MIRKKVCVIGPSAVGKTSLIRRFVKGIFAENYLTTIGVKIDNKIIATNNGDIELLVWDIEGTDIFSDFNVRYIRGAAAIIVVIDCNRKTSVFDALQLVNSIEEKHEAPCFLAINKCDLASQLNTEDHQALAHHGFRSTISTSAKSGENVESLFQEIGALLVETERAHG